MSLPGSAMPELGFAFSNVTVQPLRVPVPPVVELLVMVRFQLPCALNPANAVASDSCGVNVAKNGASPCSIGVAALSSKTVLSKLAVEAPVPSPLATPW